MTEEEIYEKAKKRVKAKKGFFIHFGVFLATVGLLFTINYITLNDGGGIWWAFIPTVAWSIGIVAHYITIFGVGIVSQFIASFGFDVPTDDNWEENELEKEMQKLRNQSNLAAKDEMEDHPEEALELKEIEKLKDEFDDKDFV